MTLVRLEPTALQPRVERSTIEPLCSLERPINRSKATQGPSNKIHNDANFNVKFFEHKIKIQLVFFIGPDKDFFSIKL